MKFNNSSDNLLQKTLTTAEGSPCKNDAFLESLSLKFVDHIEAAKKKKDSSLVYKIINVEKPGLIIKEKPFQIFSLKSSLFETIVVSNTSETKVISFKKELVGALNSSKDLFELIIANLNHKVELLFLNLAFLASVNLVSRNGALDGFIEKTKKNNYNFSDLNHILVGRSFEEYLYKNLNREVKVSLSTDYSSLASAALHLVNPETFVITAIVANGLNFGFFENNNTFVNLEAGEFLVAKDKRASNAASGLNILRKFNESLKTLNIEKTVNNLTEANNLSLDDSSLSQLLNDLYTKSATIVAAQLVGIIKYHQKAHSKSKFKIVVEGDLFWKTENYKEQVSKKIEMLGIEKKNFEFIKVDLGYVFGVLKVMDSESDLGFDFLEDQEIFY